MMGGREETSFHSPHLHVFFGVKCRDTCARTHTVGTNVVAPMSSLTTGVSERCTFIVYC